MPVPEFVCSRLVCGGWLVRVSLVKMVDGVGGIVEVRCWVPGFVCVVEASPLDSILNLVAMTAGINDFLDFPLLLFVDDYWWWWWLLVSWDGFGARCWFE